MPTSSSIKPAAILFDLDGTLLDTAPDFIHVVNKQRQRHGLEAKPDALIRATVSNGARALINLSFGLTPEDSQFAELLDELLQLYSDHIADHSGLFEGMDSVLMQLEQDRIPWGIVTNKPVRFTTPLLSALELDRRSAVTICPDHVTQTKPDPEGLLLACKKLQCLPANCVYVGDHQRDIEAGRRAGMRTAAATYGYISDEEDVSSWLADLTLSNPTDLLHQLKLR